MNKIPPTSGRKTRRLVRVTIKKEEQDFPTFWKKFTKIFSRGEITQNSIIIAYYVLLSIFPIIIIAGNLLPLLNIDTAPISRYLAVVFPSEVQSFIMPIINNLLKEPSGGFISFGILVAIWSFSRLINSIRISMNKIYGVRKIEKNKSIWITMFNRGITFLSTAFMVFGLFLMVFAFAFGQQILEFLAPIFKFSLEPFYTVMSFRWPAILLLLLVVVAYINYFIPNVSMKKTYLWPGVLVTVAGWGLLSLGFSVYLHYFGKSFSNYGIVGTFIIFMLWLNLGSMLLLFGVVVNASLSQFKSDSFDYSSGRMMHFVESKTSRGPSNHQPGKKIYRKHRHQRMLKLRNDK